MAGSPWSPNDSFRTKVWGSTYGEQTNYLREHMTHLRRELEPDPSRPRYFNTEPGMGNRFLSRRAEIA